MKFNEIMKLKRMLDNSGIPYDFKESFGGYHIIYPGADTMTCSVIEHDYSYGNRDDLLEIMGLLTKDEETFDDVVGYLTAEDVFNRIQADYLKTNDSVVTMSLPYLHTDN